MRKTYSFSFLAGRGVDADFVGAVQQNPSAVAVALGRYTIPEPFV